MFLYFGRFPKGNFTPDYWSSECPILSTLPKNQAAMLSVIVSLSRKLSNVPAMFLLTSQLTNSTPRRCKTHRCNRARLFGQALRPFAFYRLLPWDAENHARISWCRGTIKFRHKIIGKNGRPRSWKREWDAKNFGRSENPKLNRRKNFAKRLNWN